AALPQDLAEGQEAPAEAQRQGRRAARGSAASTGEPAEAARQAAAQGADPGPAGRGVPAPRPQRLDPWADLAGVPAGRRRAFQRRVRAQTLYVVIAGRRGYKPGLHD